MKKFYIIGLTLLGLLLSKSLFVDYNVVVSFEQQATKDIEYQIFYTTNKIKDFNERASVKKLVKKTDKIVNITLPVKKIKDFRIDVGQVPGTVTVSNLKVNNKPLDLNEFIKNEDIESVQIDNTSVIITSNKDDPFMVYQSTLPKHSCARIDWSIFFVLFCFYLILSYAIVLFVNNKNNKIDAIFVVLFGILLFIPMSHISNADKSKTEKRMLAQKPELWVDGDINEKYGSQFDAWFNDRFNGRKHFIRLYSHIKKTLVISNDLVVKENDGWLFYKGEQSLDNFQNKNLFSDEELQNIAQYLSDIDNWAIKNNKHFYYFIIPDKNKIYGENITVLKKLRPDNESRANQLVNYLKENTKIKVLYLYDVLMNSKDRGLLYYKNDTHWNDFGAYIGYQEITRMIKQNYKQISPVVCNKIDSAPHEIGDLTNMLGSSAEKDLIQYPKPVLNDSSVCEYNTPDKEERNGFMCYNNNKKLNVFVLRDSFTSALKRYFNNTFKTVKYEWRYDITKDDLKYIKNNSNIIVLEQVERYIPALSNLNFPKD